MVSTLIIIRAFYYEIRTHNNLYKINKTMFYSNISRFWQILSRPTSKYEIVSGNPTCLQHQKTHLPKRKLICCKEPLRRWHSKLLFYPFLSVISLPDDEKKLCAGNFDHSATTLLVSMGINHMSLLLLVLKYRYWVHRFMASACGPINKRTWKTSYGGLAL